jgi:hypothetical protein
MNGQLGIVKSIKNDTMTVDFGNNKQIDIDTKQYKNLDHGYGVTVHKAQGATETKAVLLANTENDSMNNYNSTYVAMSRQKEELTIITDNKDQLLNQVSQEQQNSTTIISNGNQPEQDKFQEITDNLQDSFGVESSNDRSEKDFGILDKLKQNIVDSKNIDQDSKYNEIKKEVEISR